ncbi:ABC transporter ATP-binding protein [Streptomyces sp. WAC07061]|uniref:ABC transporter ATP-binding protein n=1 Tax=Streptomyces sp. WAC07061 TaxID=2487410 RepID=UPI000F7B7448|nr:ABC transporter ATP-binding protein [Streptomyces sp. WAC07061]RSS64100.1 ABC transporter ATP-binding protein [Streptomyces sp. WAC07061]
MTVTTDAATGTPGTGKASPSAAPAARRVARLFQPHRGKILLIIALVVMDTAASAGWPFLLREILDAALPRGDIGLLTLLAAGMVLAAVVANASGVLQNLLSNRAGHEVMHELRSRAYEHVQGLPVSFFTAARSGDLQARLTSDIAGMETTLTSTLTSVLSNGASVLATLTAMLLLDWRMALFVLPLLAAFVAVSRWVGAEQRSLTDDRQQRVADMTGMIEESLSVSGVLLRRSMGRSGSTAARFREASRQLAAVSLKAGLSGQWRMSALGILMASAPPLLYWGAGVIAQAEGSLPSTGTLVAFVALQQALVWPATQLLSTGVQLQASMSYFQRIFEYLDVENDIVESERPVVLRKTRGEVRFDGVGFGYAAGGACLSEVDLVVPAGSHLAVVGATGSGKTTLGHLVSRMYDVREGTVRIDGVDVRDVSFASLADTVGVVAQEPFFFNESVRRNLLYAKPDADEEELYAAARTARIHEVVLALPEGYDTVLGERGHRLSGGERQRLALARTLLRRPPVLVLDEATSALDVETEAAVMASLESAAHRVTRITIAHRLSTVRNADQIIVLDHGRIVESGRHEELTDRGGRYAELIAAHENGALAWTR